MRALFAELTRFARNEEGTVTVEAVLWIPLFFFVLMLITDTSLAFFSKAQAVRTIETGNRAFAVDPAATVADTQAWIEAQVAAFAPNAQATTITDPQKDTVSTTLRYPIRDVVLFNTLGVLSGWTITVRARRHVERDL